MEMFLTGSSRPCDELATCLGCTSATLSAGLVVIEDGWMEWAHMQSFLSVVLL